MYDYHVHSSYSDGEFIRQMVTAAADVGLDGVGITDHCIVSERDVQRRFRREFAFNFDLTYERRRAAIRDLRGEFDLRIFDGVEMDYDPRDEALVRDFLADADFDYAIGSVHELRGKNVHWDYFADLSEAEQREAVDEYFEKVVALVESELFDIAAHLDLVERNPALRGYATESHYRDVARALAETGTVTDLNAGRIDREYGEFHPGPAFRAVLAEYEVPVVAGTDAHTPDALRERAAAVRQALDAGELTVADTAAVVGPDGTSGRR